jgi:predicted nucleotidyltransferase
MHPLIENNLEAIAGLCRLHGVRSLEAFGSILRDDFDTGHSDVDVLVEFEAHAADSFSKFLDMKESLEALFQRSVDDLRVIFPHPKGSFFTYHYHVATQDSQPMSLLFACRFAHNLAIELMLR